MFDESFDVGVDTSTGVNDNDYQVMTSRMTWLMEGASAGYFSVDGTRYWQADRRPGQDTFTAHWHQDFSQDQGESWRALPRSSEMTAPVKP